MPISENEAYYFRRWEFFSYSQSFGGKIDACWSNLSCSIDGDFVSSIALGGKGGKDLRDLS